MKVIEIELKRAGANMDELTLRTQAANKDDVVRKLKELEDAFNAIDDYNNEGTDVNPNAAVGLFGTRRR